MPKRIEQVFYKCEACGKTYQKIEDAESCERLHNHVSEIVKEAFSPAEYPEEYPRKILVRFTNGKEIYYGIVEMPCEDFT